MSYSTIKANGNIKYYSEKHLADLSNRGRFCEFSNELIHYGYIGKEIYIFTDYVGENKEEHHFFAKQPAGYVYLGTGDIDPRTIGLPSFPIWTQQDIFYQIGRALFNDANERIEHAPSSWFIKQLTQYLIDYYDISQLVMHDEFESGRTQSDNEPSFDMSKYIKTIPATTLDPYSVPYHIQLPVHQKEFVITQDSIIINAFE